MPTRRRLLAWLSVAPAIGIVSVERATLVAGEVEASFGGESGVSAGLVVADDGALVLSGEPAAWSDHPFTVAGSLVGAVQALPAPAIRLSATWTGEAPAGTAVRLEVRGLDDQGALPWVETPGDGSVVRLEGPVATVQYRLTLLAMDASSGPVVRDVQVAAVEPAETVEPVLAAAQAGSAPGFRLYATRIGLIGRTTANGTVIAPEDRFVALPSRRVLAAKGGREYEVRVEYKGRSITVPVWDIGPWNVRDNYWEAPARRDMWNDLPAGRPQSVAAYFDAYHGGRDGFGRRVLSPAAIDLSDAAFYDLGMTNADWVQATMLWQARR
jgi:hypothetical protein